MIIKDIPLELNKILSEIESENTEVSLAVESIEELDEDLIIY